MTDDIPADLVERCRNAAKVLSVCDDDVRSILRAVGVPEMAGALEEARIIVEAQAEALKSANHWAQGMPLNTLEQIDAALSRYRGQ